VFGAVLLFVMAVALPPLLSASPGFTLIVSGAPPRSEVWVDDKRVGIPANDGTIKAFGMLPGEGRRVARKDVRAARITSARSAAKTAKRSVFPLRDEV
jgi:hypothetical protein